MTFDDDLRPKKKGTSGWIKLLFFWATYGFLSYVDLELMKITENDPLFSLGLILLFYVAEIGLFVTVAFVIWKAFKWFSKRFSEPQIMPEL